MTQARGDARGPVRGRPAGLRLAAGERRAVIVDAALAVFAGSSYAGATTSAIARAAGVTEPILYRHFPSKRDLYLACLAEAWAQLSAAVDAESVALGRPVGIAHMHLEPGLRRLRRQLASLWVIALTESGDDPEIQARLRDQLLELHGLVVRALESERARGALPEGRDPHAEAWITVAGTLLQAVAERVGGLLDDDDLARIAAARRAWLLPDEGGAG